MKLTFELTIDTNLDLNTEEIKQLAEYVEAGVRFYLWPEITDQVNDTTVKPIKP